MAMIVFGTVFVCAAFFLWAPDSVLNKPCGDCYGGGYVQVAKNFLEGKGWTDNNGAFATARPPGHSLIIVVLLTISQWTDYPEIYIFWIFNTSMLALSSILLFMIARLVWQDKHAAFIPVVWMTSPFALWFLNQPYSEMPFFSSFFASLLLALFSFRANGGRRHLFAFFVGVVSAIAIMIKPVAIGIPILYFVVLVLTRPGTPWKSHVIYFFALSFGVFLVLAPWSTIVHNKTGEIIVLTNGQLTFNSSMAGITFATEADGDREKLHIPNRVKKLLETIEDELNFDQELAHRNKNQTTMTNFHRIGKVMWNNPVAAIQFLGIKITRSWYGTYSHRNEMIAALLQVVYLGAILLSLIRGIRLKLLPNDFLVVSLSITFYYWSMSVLFEPIVRYMIPAIGILYVLLPALWHSKARGATSGRFAR